MMALIQRWMDEKAQESDVEKVRKEEEDQTGPQDFLEKLLATHNKQPDKIAMYDVSVAGSANVMAGSDTTAATISGILYHLMRNPDKMQKLRHEIAQFEAQNKMNRPVRFKESQQMPYLQAVLKEGMRLHAAVGLPLWRDVPEGGAEVCGRFFPEGSVVGLNAWTAHYNEDVFEDPYAFRPERWIGVDADKQREMEGYYLPVSGDAAAANDFVR